VAALLSGGAVFVTLAQVAGGDPHPSGALAGALDWQPGRSWPELWRPWTSAWVHWSLTHLLVNLLGAAAVAAVGWRARASDRAALAWFLAWPLTQALLALTSVAPGHGLHAAQPMAHYGGLSGVLHAGVMVIGLALVFPRSLASSCAAGAGLAPLTPAQQARHRLVGLGIAAGTLAKVLLEAPWDLALRPSALLGIEVAPLAHACGVAAGTLAWGVVATMGRPRRRNPKT
jgi:hypothetical protein